VFYNGIETKKMEKEKSHALEMGEETAQTP